ncbi:MAG: ubiquinol-cytochrome c reductase iron-sulfur subunit [Acidobacteria bacterium]|nr:ubiquinol-cytochrome c reductase iron-sulfur subunit [Acidobacteriota bacterium]
MDDQAPEESYAPENPQRRDALRWLPTVALGGALTAAYGTFAGYVGRFLFPARPTDRGWLFVREVQGLDTGETLLYRLPNGNPVNITRRGETGSAEDFIALSSTCPHLGCQVHWEPQNDRFFCPCHNGIFTPEGKAIGGPPGEAGQSLPQYPLKVEGGLLFIQVPLEVADLGPGRLETPGPVRGAGHDPCLCGQGAPILDTLGRGREA